MLIKLRKTFLKGVKRLLLFLIVAFVASSLLLIGVFRYLPVPVTTFMFYRQMTGFQEGNNFKAINHHWVDSDKISKHAFAAVIAAEDQWFYQHHGYDTASMISAIETWLDGGRLRGASTISQQVAKNLFLVPTRSFWRKGFEAWFTVLIEAFWSKERILEVYLNSVEFGDHLFGIEAASQHYFGISSMRLSRKQAALLAASLPNPIKFNTAKPSAYMLRRQSWILLQMNNLGY
ncbi:monofunctional biosynthetic peptidoglycan transglycosylase [Methyloprofundus sedimenti]|uniref:Biosynthetic peptidoglycan transglycosylase n=1 Tax=Methyloprofundus sedimenti TaxID=1420851 RepID=A0A1V8M7I6_9GAMM|nr:monofunctional biosynthetic peptidoglycan transglycosylase [Methyloprofundus sedimenti]OQK17492.1 monofunctional biosynthetic peptidoglycan transglycosylase [Methyloprofundus sedimenti]